ncbi:MAG: hypothetical protein A2504_01785 [Bdellovibrionales bacterium RIFOXYD12_FULL_39_22]|nr:MAG: hypothetical protein A2385_04310 [Bdellovibrionales bacterium RIFOXYB1_FULL_39_21]OFZ42363.1 MAG: hypothetical protein A2485_15185 [Bdellovibrionales bacterium RIFOXYC12_FULL_39_17]OFZ46336.1 MAG: hypothetical protein A2404_13830 [Bdellovibrionales bacterium RIFOXYC1_FULL_39_130]OFZ73125.1 MAG: hypothetical protein A2451_06720 [Bdellovibrionales bacterium RIFOXYC2_FULL_39_8]OFZ75229.1 MAG: hypothetical protein A2560_15885 [Bdellovibrionales bacterium RIFOXYD1_FULL_39_84]OFZ93223.1 MAG:
MFSWFFSIFRKKSAKDRKFVRVSPDAMNPILVDIIGGNVYDTVNAKDISLGGVSVTLFNEYKVWKMNKYVDISIKLPGEKSFALKGQVRNKSPQNRDRSFTIGILFLGIDEEARIKLRRYINSRADYSQLSADDSQNNIPVKEILSRTKN